MSTQTLAKGGRHSLSLDLKRRKCGVSAYADSASRSRWLMTVVTPSPRMVTP
jgi:hypothetical protein